MHRYVGGPVLLPVEELPHLALTTSLWISCVVQFPCYQKCLVMFLFMTDGSVEVGHVRRNWLCCFLVFHAHHSCIQLWLCQSICVDELCHDSLSTKSSVRGCAHEMNKTSYSGWRGSRESIMVARKESKKIHSTWQKKNPNCKMHSIQKSLSRRFTVHLM